MKKPTVKPKRFHVRRMYIAAAALVLLGYVSGVLLTKLLAPPRYELATVQSKEQDISEITKQYSPANKRSSPSECQALSQTAQTMDEMATAFTTYLKVNGYGNRAVIRGCNGDELLYKNKDGRWEQTYVNVRLDTRVNREWQKACLIQDITRTDDVVRPENGSIDSGNLKLCKRLVEYKNTFF